MAEDIVKPEETLEIDMNKQPEEVVSDTVGEEVFEGDIDFIKSNIERTGKLKQPLTSAPTYTPKDFYEQEAHYNGSLYKNINNTWVKIANDADIPSALVVAKGTGTRTHAAGTGTQNIAHGLGVTPSFVRIEAVATTSYNVTNTLSIGTCTGTDDESCMFKYDGVGNGVSRDTSHIIMTVNAGGSAVWSATVSTLDSTNITLNFDTASAGRTIEFQWEAYK